MNTALHEDWQSQRSVSPLRFQLLLSALNLSQAACGRYLGVSPRTVKRYLTGQTRVPVASCLLLASLLAAGTKPVVPKRKRK